MPSRVPDPHCSDKYVPLIDVWHPTTLAAWLDVRKVTIKLHRRIQTRALSYVSIGVVLGGGMLAWQARGAISRSRHEGVACRPRDCCAPRSVVLPIDQLDSGWLSCRIIRLTLHSCSPRLNSCASSKK